MLIVQDCIKDKVVDVLNKMGKGNAGLFFSHGLGDCILFMPIYKELVKRFTKWNIIMCFAPERDYSFLCENSMVLKSPYGNYADKFDVIFDLKYPEAPRTASQMISFSRKYPHIKKVENLCKPYVCNLLEIGLDNFEWKPFLQICPSNNIYSKTIGVHFFGRPSGAIRNCEINFAKSIWDEIKFCGFNPIEIQMFSSDVPFWEAPDFIGPNTLRHKKASLDLMANEILNCRYFFGIDSGPLYFATSLIGFEKCIALERERKINKVLPQEISLIDIDNYKEGSVLKMLYQKEKKNGEGEKML